MPEMEIACADCGEDHAYVDPDNGLCDICTAILRAMERTAAVGMQTERTMADLYDDAPCEGDVRVYKLRRYHNGRRMAQGAQVLALDSDHALRRARSLFPEPEYRHDKFEIESVG